MAVMQAQINILVISDTVVLHISRKCVGSVGLWGPIGTGQKGLDGYSAPIGGATGLAANNPIICATQIVPQSFGENMVTSQGQVGRDPSQGEGSVFTRREYTHRRMVMHGK